MDAKTRTLGLICPLLDWHGDREPGAVPPELGKQVRAVYAATEVFVLLEVALVEKRPRWPALLVAALRVAWAAGVLAGRASVVATSEADSR
tara:strand:+ start:403 stop:675 length:273 start_codon:yes stop_codon:yes gene_type:complete